MNPAMKRATLFGGLLVAATLAVLALAVRDSFSHACEVCVTYGGRTACREARGANVEEATRTATDNACAFLASGMTESIRCGNTRPDSVHCDGNAVGADR